MDKKESTFFNYIKGAYIKCESGIIFFIVLLISSLCIAPEFAKLLKVFRYDLFQLEDACSRLIVAGVILYVIGILFPSLIYIKIKHVKIKFKTSFKNIILCILLGFAIQPLAILLNMFASFFTSTNNVTDMLIEYSDVSIIPFLISSAILPAIFEELAFRGILVTDNVKKLGIMKIAIFSALCFGLMHLNLRQFIYAFVLGIFFAYVYNKTKSLLSTIVIHFTVNASQTTLGLLLIKSIDKELLLTPDAEPSFYSTLITIVIASIIIIPIFYPLCKKLYSILDEGKDEAKDEI